MTMEQIIANMVGREIKEQFQGGKPLTLYVVGQLFNIVLTFAAVYLLLSGKFFPLPNLAL